MRTTHLLTHSTQFDGTIDRRIANAHDDHTFVDKAHWMLVVVRVQYLALYPPVFIRTDTRSTYIEFAIFQRVGHVWERVMPCAHEHRVVFAFVHSAVAGRPVQVDWRTLF
jgi:hypothetical protein